MWRSKKCIQTINIHTILNGGKSPWYSEGYAKCTQVTWAIPCTIFSRTIIPPGVLKCLMGSAVVH